MRAMPMRAMPVRRAVSAASWLARDLAFVALGQNVAREPLQEVCWRNIPTVGGVWLPTLGACRAGQRDGKGAGEEQEVREGADRGGR